MSLQAHALMRLADVVVNSLVLGGGRDNNSTRMDTAGLSGRSHCLRPTQRHWQSVTRLDIDSLVFL